MATNNELLKKIARPIILCLIVLAIVALGLISIGFFLLSIIANICGGGSTGGVLEVIVFPWIIGLIALIAFLVRLYFIINNDKSQSVVKSEEKVKAPENDPILNDYLNRARKANMSDEEIRRELLSAGWPEDKVNKLF